MHYIPMYIYQSKFCTITCRKVILYKKNCLTICIIVHHHAHCMAALHDYYNMHTTTYAHNSCVVETSVEENFTVSLQTSILQNYNYIRFVYEDLRLCSEMSYFWRIINVCYLQRCACIFQQLYMMILLYANI